MASSPSVVTSILDCILFLKLSQLSPSNTYVLDGGLLEVTTGELLLAWPKGSRSSLKEVVASKRFNLL